MRSIVSRVRTGCVVEKHKIVRVRMMRGGSFERCLSGGGRGSKGRGEEVDEVFIDGRHDD